MASSRLLEKLGNPASPAAAAAVASTRRACIRSRALQPGQIGRGQQVVEGSQANTAFPIMGRSICKTGRARNPSRLIAHIHCTPCREDRRSRFDDMGGRRSPLRRIPSAVLIQKRHLFLGAHHRPGYLGVAVGLAALGQVPGPKGGLVVGGGKGVFYIEAHQALIQE